MEAVTIDIAVVPSETQLLPTGNKLYATETLQHSLELNINKVYFKIMPTVIPKKQFHSL